MNYRVHSGKRHTVRIDGKTDASAPFAVQVDKRDYHVEIRKVRADGRIQTLMVNHQVCPIEVERRGDGMPVRVYLKGVPYDVEISKVASTRLRAPEAEPVVEGTVSALLPGRVLGLLVEIGQTVKQGEPLLILEAMKMENEIPAPRDGKVARVLIQEGQNVSKGDVLLELE